jgi:hypothetical protein
MDVFSLSIVRLALELGSGPRLQVDVKEGAYVVRCYAIRRRPSRRLPKVSSTPIMVGLLTSSLNPK